MKAASNVYVLKQSEAQIQESIISYLKYLAKGGKLKFWRMQIGGTIIRGQKFKNALKGFPDIQGAFPDGRMFVIEIKASKGKLSDLQKDWLESLAKFNVACLVAFSVEDVVEFIKDHL